MLLLISSGVIAALVAPLVVALKTLVGAYALIGVFLIFGVTAVQVGRRRSIARQNAAEARREALRAEEVGTGLVRGLPVDVEAAELAENLGVDLYRVALGPSERRIDKFVVQGHANRAALQARVAQQHRRRDSTGRKMFVIGLWTVVYVELVTLIGQGAHSGPNPDEALAQCQQFVKGVLKSPSTADFPSNADSVIRNGDRFTVVSYVDAENSFGASLRENYTCVVQHKRSDTWQLLRLRGIR